MELVLRFRVHCRDCKKLKPMFEDAACTEKPGRRVMYDSEGRTWNGRQCYNCKQAAKRVVREKVEKHAPTTVGGRGRAKTFELGLESKLRFCRRDHGGCGKPMPATRYYLCMTCQPALDDDPGDFAYS